MGTPRSPLRIKRARGLRRGVFFVFAMLAAAFAAASNACGSSDRRPPFDDRPEAGLRDAPASPETAPSFGSDAADTSACGLARASGDPLGCEYFLFNVDWYENGTANCVPLLVSNPGATPARLNLEWAGAPVDVRRSARIVTGSGRVPVYDELIDDELPPGASAVIALLQGKSFPLEPDSRCPFPAVVDDTMAGAMHSALGSEATGRTSGPAFRLTATEPVLAVTLHLYNVERDVGAGGTTLRSVESWGKEYLDVGVYRPGRPLSELPSYPGCLPSFTALVAKEATTIELMTKGGKKTLQLKAHEAVRMTQDDLFIGTKISGDHPFGAFAGSPDPCIPFHVPSGDSVLHSYAAPAQWGREYAAAPYPRRYPPSDDPAVWRILARGDGTVLSYDPRPPAGAPTLLKAGELGVFSASEAFVVTSQDSAHPFHLSELMTSTLGVCSPEDVDAGFGCRGDPELFSIPPPDELANRVSFLTERTYPDTHLVVVRRKREQGGFADVTLDCAGALTGWVPIGSGDTYETVSIALSRGKFEPQVYAGGTCGFGPHSMKSDGLFTVQVWGWDHAGAWDEPHVGGSLSYGFTVLGLRDRPDAGPRNCPPD